MVRRRKEQMSKTKWTPDRIKHLREEVYVETQETFCDRFPVSIDTLRYWEQGRGVPSRMVQSLLDSLELASPNGHRKAVAQVS